MNSRNSKKNSLLKINALAGYCDKTEKEEFVIDEPSNELEELIIDRIPYQPLLM